MQIIGSILIGFFAGLIARFLMPGRDAMGFVLTSVLGIAGAVIATFLGRALGLYGVEEPAGFLASIVGAVLVLYGYKVLSGKKAGTLTAASDHRRAA